MTGCTCTNCANKRCAWCYTPESESLFMHRIVYGCDSKGNGGTPMVLCDTCYQDLIDLGNGIKSGGESPAEEH